MTRVGSQRHRKKKSFITAGRLLRTQAKGSSVSDDRDLVN